jgi:hypothetical protein
VEVSSGVVPVPVLITCPVVHDENRIKIMGKRNVDFIVQ